MGSLWYPVSTSRSLWLAVITFHHFPSFSLSFLSPVGQSVTLFSPLCMDVIELCAAQNVVCRPAGSPSPGFVRNADSLAIPRTNQQSLHFNNIPMWFERTLNFEKRESLTCLPGSWANLEHSLIWEGSRLHFTLGLPCFLKWAPFVVLHTHTLLEKLSFSTCSHLRPALFLPNFSFGPSHLPVPAGIALLHSSGSHSLAFQRTAKCLGN